MKNKKQNLSGYLQVVYLCFVSMILLLTTLAEYSNAADVTLQWNSVAEADGYKVYYGNASRTYQPPEDAGNQTTHMISLDPGTYYFAVTAYNNYGESGYSVEVGPTTITANTPPTSVSLTSDFASPQPAGSSVTFTAQATGGSGNHEYVFWIKNPAGDWELMQDYSSGNTFVWIASGIGTSIIWVGAKNAGTNEGYQVYSSVSFSTDTNPPGSSSLTSDLPSPQSEGTEVTFTAQATGGSGTYEYQFWLRDIAGQWIKVQDYSSNNTFVWNTTGVGTSMIWVGVKNAGSDGGYQVFNSLNFSTDINPPGAVSLISDLPSPQSEGTGVTFTAQATGGSGTYEYQFWLRDIAGQWIKVQDYSPDNTFVWNTTGVGTNVIWVGVKNAGIEGLYQICSSVYYEIN